MVWSPNRLWFGYFQQDGGYPNRMDPNGNVLGFLDRLDAKRRSPGASPDPFKNIFWLQQRPSDPSADTAYAKGRKAYYDEIRKHIAAATADYDRFSGGTPAPAPPPPATYGLPPGSNSGGYGGSGVKFPDWVYALGNAFGVKPSTYPGHQESDRGSEAGYARNPQRLNRGIDWAAPGAPDQWERLTRFADYLATIPQHLEQVIWRNPKTKRSIEVAGGRHQPGYFAADLAGHEDHVHTRQSRPIPLPGNTQPPPPPVPVAKPKFEERQMIGWGSSKRSRPAINFFLHTQEPLSDSTAEGLARYCQGQNDVSYHFTIRDRIVYDVVPSELASWSVLEANVFSVNLCFAGSSAAMSRQLWLDRYAADIEIAAYIAVREARRHNFSTEVLIPQAGKQGRDVYAGEARPGISDHNYVTRELGIGSHTDVGPGFPWDIFKAHVDRFANNASTQGDDDLSAADVARLESKLDLLIREWGPNKKGPSRAFMATDGKPVESPLGFIYNIDGNVWSQQLTWAYLFDVPLALDVVETVARNGPYDGSWADSEDFNAWLREFGQAYCQGLIDFKAALVAKLVDGSSSQTSGPINATGPSAAAIAAEVAALMPAPDNRIDEVYNENATLHAKNAQLQEQLSQVQTQLALQAVQTASTEIATTPGAHTAISWGDAAGGVVTAQQQWTELLLSLDGPARQQISVALQALNLPVGSTTSNGSPE